MDRSRLAIVIPALNEARTIAQVVAAVLPFGSPVVVDDGSSDATGALAEQAGAEVVRLPVNQGYDGALNAGFAWAAAQGFSYLVTVDADGQHDPPLIARFVSALDAGADVVVGIRDRQQRLGEHVFAWVGRRRWAVDDPMCGMKAYRTSVYSRRGWFDSYGSIGTELCLYAASNGMRVEQVAVRTLDRADQPRFGRRWSANRRILRALAVGLWRYRLT
jgi:glycosyltransferase involved in cell wall biosynthesis